MRAPGSRHWIAFAIVAVMVLSSAVAVVALAPTVGGPSTSVHAAVTAAPTAAPAAKGTSGSAGSLGIDAARAATVKSDEQALLARGGDPSLFLPPNLHQAPPLTRTGGHVVPLYSIAPAPMGVAYYGLSNTTGSVQATTVNTTSLQATFSTNDPLGVQTEEFDFSGQTSYGAQLNAVLTNVTLFGQTSYGANPNAPTGCVDGGIAPACPNEFWLQNVIGYNPATSSLTLENNIWNFSNPTGGWSSGTNALIGFSSPRGGFYAVSGPSITVSYPFTLALYLNTTSGPCHTDSTPGTGVPSCTISAGNGGGTVSTTAPVNEVFFNYSVWNSLGQHVCPSNPGTGKVCGEYDDVFFNSVNPSVNPAGVPPTGPGGRVGSAVIQANGSGYDPVGLTNDFEMDWGIGTSSGATNDVVYADASVGINYCTAADTTATGACSAYSATPAAYGYGGETGETSTGAAVNWATQGTSGTGPTLLTGAGTPVAKYVTGPSLLRGLWNASGAAYPSGAGENALSYAHISPANAWVGIAAGSGVTNQSNFQVAPTFGWFSARAGSGGAPRATTMGANLYLTPGAYTVEVLLSGYTPYIGNVNLATGGAAPTIALVANASTGVYTPLWAFSKADLANISTNPTGFGLGTPGNPIHLESAAPTVGAPYGETGSMSWLFSNLNDYLFTVWIGEYLNATTAYAQSNPAPPLLMEYPTWQYASLDLFDVPLTDQFQMYFYEVQNFTLAGTTGITSWANSEATTLYSVVCNACKNVLIADNTFSVSDRGLEFLNGGATAPSGAALTDTRNVVWGNTFNPDAQPSYVGLTSPSTGLVLSESFDRVWNNAFYTNGTATASGSNSAFWNVTCVGGYNPLGSATYPGATTCEPASYTTTYLGFSLTGSILGTSYQGGNFWFNYGNAANPYGNIPYNAHSSSVTSSAGIGATLNPYRGDYAPLTTTTVYDPTFYATGLPSSSSSTAFEVRVGYVGGGWLNDSQTTTPSSVCSGGPCVVFYVPSGSYTYDGFSGLTGAQASAASPATGTFTVSGAPVGTVTTFAFGLSHAVTFTESGLPVGTHWTVNVPGQLSVTSATATVVFTLPNGAYTYTINGVPGYNTTFSGSFSVSGSAVGISVPWVVTEYGVTFDESGLSSGDSWTASVSGQSPITATVSGVSGTSQAENLANGTYPFTITTNDPTYQPSYGSPVVINGAWTTIPVTFNEVTYGVSFSESGLPSGQTWSVTFNGATMSTTTDGLTDTLTFANEPNGTYTYSIADVPGWHQTSLAYSGTLTLSGAALAESVTFAQVTYDVSLAESGLPSGQTFSATVAGSTLSLTTDGSTDALDFGSYANGTYSYSVADVSGYHQSTIAYSGTITVAGAAVYDDLVFTQVTNTLTFTESGLPASTSWSVTVGGTTLTSTTTSIGFSEPNGTYPYTVGVVPGYSTTQSSSVTVTGATDVAVPFSVVEFSVTFTETGLPAGTSWSVTLNGATQSATTTSIVFEEPNGTYSYTVGVVQNYTTTQSGSVSVTGANTGVSVPFTLLTYPVTFVESGLPSGTMWSVTIGGTTVSSTTTSLVFQLSNGTYTYHASAVANYARTATGSFAVVGTPVTVNEAYTHVLYTVTFKEAGLPAGTSWSVTTAGKTKTTTTAKNLFSLGNGTYAYTIGAVHDYSTTHSGSVTVNGASVLVTVHFTLVKYKVTFTESGLPRHTSWQVTVGSSTVSSSVATLSMELANGTYSYSASAPGTSYTSSGGSFSVSGAATPVAVSFS
jgi:hypothetical protein